MNHIALAVLNYKWIRDRISLEQQDIDEETLADTVEGLTDLHEIIGAIIRSALLDESLISGLKGRVKEMHERLTRLEERASKCRRLARDVMSETGIKKITAADFTVSVRAGSPSLIVIDEALIPEGFWEPQPPRLNRQSLSGELKNGHEIPGAGLSNPEPILSVRSK